MKKGGKRADAGRLVWALCCGSAMLAHPALAQDNGAATGEATSGALSDNPEILVTGTLIRGWTQKDVAPVDVITATDLARQGSPTMVDLLRQLPNSNGTLAESAQFDSRSQFNEGTASVNLRSLGPQRTLVLLNGKRMVSSASGNVPVVDINMIPAAALERVEILKDGAATTYGSDAIAGVVNFVTRTDQDGFLASGDYRYIDGSDGDGSAALSWGGSMGDARLFLSAGYQHRSELRVTDRDFAMLPYDRNPQGGWSGGGAPGNFDFNGSAGGLSFTADEGCEALGGFRSRAGSSADLCNTDYLSYSNLIEPEDRYQFLADLSLPLSDRVDLRLTGLYGHTDTVLTTTPSYLPTISPSENAAYGGSGLFVIPSYAPALIDYCARYGEAAGCSLGADNRPDRAALAYPVRFRSLLASGNPLYDNDQGAAVLDRNSDFYHISGELRADLSDSLQLTTSLTFSEYDRYFQGGDSFVDPLQNALAGFGGAGCAYATPQSRAGLSEAELAARAGRDGCLFLNPFSSGMVGNSITGEANPHFAGTDNPLGLDLTPGAGLINDASVIESFFTVIERGANTRQWVGDAVLSGSTGITLPGGDVQFALGGQYRKNRYARTYGATNNLDAYPCPGSVLVADATCDTEVGPIGFLGSNRNVAVSSDVLAVFGELQLPLTSHIRAQISARYEDYGASVGSTFDPQARVSIGLTDWLTLRGGVGSTFRGPPSEATGADLVVMNFIGGAFRPVDQRANPALKPESATTYNAGFTVAKGPLHASLDYWRYDFEGAIEGEPVNGIVSALFGASGTENCGNPAYAGLEARFTFSGGVCGASNVQRFTTYNINAADVMTSGVDFQASLEQGLGDVLLQGGVSGSYVIDYKVGDVVVEGITVQPAFDAAGSLNYQTTAYPLPHWKGQLFAQALWGRQSLRFQLNYIGPYTDRRGDAVFGPDNAVLAGEAVTAGKRIGSFATLDMSYRITLPSRTSLSLTLANIFDEDPPFARLDQNYDPLTANALGFTAKIGVTQAF
ncbi:TonB-dependent receptor [Altericroceibacterium spongiae]|uniref:TonB-dependent receptor n=1 Tax=Altericroceibacterium spongiae TaxID=2320269 RepID=A0A420EFC1_9SPHN|nr:TonB-dependent receptor [Altericroceibacterium spongiae]RKF19401.1 TonB-dependent receptor [Altericroceibacterium spongiae]